MSEDNLADAEFMALADAFVNLANERSSEAGSVKVGAAMLFAATRFNACLVASRTRDVDELKSDRTIALQHFSEQHSAMLTENLNDYENNYASYIAHTRNTQRG